MIPYRESDIFTPEECARVIETCEQYGLKKGTTYTTKKGEVDAPRFRLAFEVRPPQDEKTAWILDRCELFIARANEQMGFLLNENRNLEWCFVKYPLGGHFAQHTDTYGAERRKITGSIQLTDPAEYDGGDLIAFNHQEASRDIGSGFAFPSFMVHHVEKVTRGSRYALIFWAHGEQHFR